MRGEYSSDAGFRTRFDHARRDAAADDESRPGDDHLLLAHRRVIAKVPRQTHLRAARPAWERHRAHHAPLPARIDHGRIGMAARRPHGDVREESRRREPLPHHVDEVRPNEQRLPTGPVSHRRCRSPLRQAGNDAVHPAAERRRASRRHDTRRHFLHCRSRAFSRQAPRSFRRCRPSVGAAVHQSRLRLAIACDRLLVRRKISLQLGAGNRAAQGAERAVLGDFFGRSDDRRPSGARQRAADADSPHA